MIADWDNTYARLPNQMYAQQVPTPVASPSGLALNKNLAADLGISFDSDWFEYMSGNKLPYGANPISQAYAGHQFGHWNPQLGDGRAILLGEVTGGFGHIDLQLKGAGRTPWSRSGDGRAWYGPILREYLVSEAMHSLGIPTTRALAAAATGEKIFREQGPLPGAVICRTASSHIRVGTFQYFASRNDLQALQSLFDYTVRRHFPEAKTVENLLQEAVKKHASLVASWMAVGFIHGVMNTDNSHVAGITIDYGPCAFMDYFVPTKVFSSIDRQGRYAYNNQAKMAAWNLAQLATALLPLATERESAIEHYTEIIHGFSDTFEKAYDKAYSQKIGYSASKDSSKMIQSLLKMMAEQGADYTLTFRALGEGTVDEHLGDHPDFKQWYENWLNGAKMKELHKVNPAIIPRNHLIEEMISKATTGDMELFYSLSHALNTPFEHPQNPRLGMPPEINEEVTATFCGT
tara:strand:- start:770 stop:2155 length:1386 start_codon:yes stop_codon:yes gene_type:complete